MNKTLVMIAVALSFFLKTPAVNSADWQFYDKAPNGSSFFYDRENVSDSGGILKVYQKEVYRENSLLRLRDRLGPKYADLKEVINLIEIDCAKDISRTNSVTYYDSDGKAIDTRTKGRRWIPVSRKAGMDMLLELCCPSDWIYVSSSKDDDYFLNAGRMEPIDTSVTFWIRTVNKSTGKEAERDKFTIRCSKDDYALRYHVKYKPDGSVSKVDLYETYSDWTGIPEKAIIALFRNAVCSEGRPRTDPKTYLDKTAR